MILYDNNMLVLRRKEPFVNWVQEVSHQMADMLGKIEISEQDIKEMNPSCYIIPLFKSQSEAEEYVQKIFQHIFENELVQWCVDVTLWPEKIDYKTFCDWFELDFHSAVIGMQLED